MTTARQRITLDEPVKLLVRPVDAEAEAVTAAFRFDPDQPRDSEGRWGDGVDTSAGTKADRLKLAGRIDLDPGERLVGSAKVNIKDDNNESEMFVAVTDSPDGPQLRVGIPAPDYGDPDYDDEGNVVDRNAWSGNNPADTARLDRAGQERMRAEFDEHNRTARARQVEAERNFSEIERLEKRYHQLYDEANARRDPETLVLAPEDRAKINAVQDELDPLHEWQENFQPDALIAEGVIPGVSGQGSLAYAIEGDDDGKFGWTFRFAVRPPDAPAGWSMYDPRTEGGTVLMDATDQGRLQKLIDSMVNDTGAVTAAFRFDPDQPRDREGKWTDGPVGGVGVLSDSDSWSAQADDPGNVTSGDLLRIGAAIGAIMSRDGTSMADPVAMFRATTEAVAADDADITARQYVRAMDRDYGTSLDKAITNALAASDTPEDQAAGQPQVAPAPPPPEPGQAAPPEWSPDFGDSVEERRRKLQQGIDSGIVDADNLAGGDIAETVRFDWKDGSKSVLKAASRTVRRGVTPKDQTDAEELAGLVGNAIGVRAPVTQRISENEIYLEYMPGQSAMQKLRGASTYRFTNSEQGLNMGLLDHLIGNSDRHDGNWTIDDDDNIYAIDHGLAFTEQDTGMTFGPFAFELFYGGHKIPRARLDEVRSQLKELQPEFKRLRRREWYEQMFERLDELQARIGGE